MLRNVLKYPFSEIIDETFTMHGSEHQVIRQEQSLVFNLDVDHVDTTVQEFIQKNFSPEKVDYLSDDEMKSDNVFELISPLGSRFVTDRAMRANLAKEMERYVEERKGEIESKKNAVELKEKYDKFIASLG